MRRFVSAFINIVSAIIVVCALCILHIHFPGETANTVLNTTYYEDSTEFKSILQDRLDSIFALIALKNSFETNGELNYSLTVAESVDSNNTVKKWTIKNCIDKAVAHGLYIDKNFNVELLNEPTTKPFSKEIIYNFMFKTFPSNSRTGTSSEEEFLTEFIYTLAKYYRYKLLLSDTKSNFKYRISYFDSFDKLTHEYSNTKISSEDILSNSNFIYLSSKENIISSDLDSINSSTLKRAKENNYFTDNTFNLYCFIDQAYPIDDEFQETYNIYVRDKHACAILLTTIIYATIVFVISLFLTAVFILSTKKKLDQSRRLFYVIPTELYVIVYILLTTGLYFYTYRYINSAQYINYDMNPIKVYVYTLITYANTLLLLLVFTSKFSNDTLTPVSLVAIRETTHQGTTYLNPGALFSMIFVPIILFIILSIYLIYLFTMVNDFRILVIGVIILLSTLGFSIYLIALHNGFNKAIQSQIKSNEMRTSLISNVTHDIKTPLTAILNYTTLISEEIQKPSRKMMEKLENYSDAIINKSHRLNDLINDLIFDSKVTSGNVSLEMTKLDLNAFITQIIAEFSPKLDEMGLKTIYNNSANKTHILSDGTQLYRVFQNLFTNIYKYALENSRVYIDLESAKSKITVTIKNIQREKLEVNPDTLKDRFVRGSKSRTTEGFGLGLSISENLINSMNGKLEITSNRDLFIAKLVFVAYDE